ncbi:MAG: hypothetical protein E7555_09065 [Ruminococcaceae bacterium]|nr:hypothetical protein [Oscillospiraceae bacterium]
MKYDFTNTILYNDKGVYYQVNSYANDRLSIGQIKKPPEGSSYRLVRLEDLYDGRTSIIYEKIKDKNNYSVVYR